MGIPLNIAALLNNAEQDVRAGFIRKVYGILSVQLLIIVLLAVPLQQMTPAQAHANIWVLIVSSSVLVVAMCALICSMETFRKYPRNCAVLGADHSVHERDRGLRERHVHVAERSPCCWHYDWHLPGHDNSCMGHLH